VTWFVVSSKKRGGHGISCKNTTTKTMEKRVGKKVTLWNEIRNYLFENYDHEPVLGVGKRDFAWTIRYRKSGKTLVTLFPEENDFCVLSSSGKRKLLR